MSDTRSRIARALFLAACALLLAAQLALSAYQVATYWQWGHNGYNPAAYQVAARNSLRFHVLWPAQYHISDTKPKTSDFYTHAPLGLHLVTTASVAVFGDAEWAVRLPNAVFSFLAALMLLVLLARHWGRAVALIGTALYVSLPINTVYCNMTNHSTGCIFFSLLMLEGYLSLTRSRRAIWLLPLLLGMAGATLYDWPGFTISVCVGIAALYEGLRPAPGGRAGIASLTHVVLGLGMLLFVAGTFGGFLLWIKKATGITDLAGTIMGRSETSNLLSTLKSLYGSVVSLMFPTIVRAIAIAWLLASFVRHAARRFLPRDVVPVSFFVAGMAQFVLFPNAAAIHHYWNWQFNPFVAIACAEMLWWGAQVGVRVAGKLGRWPAAGIAVQALFWAGLLVPFAKNYAPQAAKLMREGRALGGSFGIGGYNRDYKKVAFARLVNGWTDWHNGVAIHSASLSHRIEVEATIDRQWSDVQDRHLAEVSKYLDAKKKWVLIGDQAAINLKLLLPYVGKHPWTVVDSYFFIDLRREGTELTVFAFEPKKPTWAWKFLVTPYDPPLELKRSPVLEAQLAEKLRLLAGEAASQPAPPPAAPPPPSELPGKKLLPGIKGIVGKERVPAVKK